MSVFRAVLVRLRSLVRHSAVEQELDEELRFHVERETERLVAGGMSERAAAETARRTFGNVAYLKDESRDARSIRVVEHIARDLAHSVRLARKQPLSAAVIVLSLALGLGATTAVFNLSYNVLFATLPLPQPEQLAALVRVTDNDRDISFSWSEYRALRELRGAGDFAALRSASQIPVSNGQQREYINIQFVDGAFFPIIELRAARGRLIDPQDDARHSTVAVISEQFAERLFPGDTAVIGREIAVRGIPFTVVGVTPNRYRGLQFPGQFTIAIPLSTASMLVAEGRRVDDYGLPLELSGEALGDRRAFRIVGRLASDRAAAARMFTLALERCCADPRTAGEHARIELLDLSRGMTGKNDVRGQVGMLLLILLAGMGLLLAVVCCNIASLLVVRAAARQREIALRLSLGASRGRLLAQLVLETLPLAIIGGIAGLWMASWATTLLLHALPDFGEFADVFGFRLGLPMFGFTTVITLSCAIGSATYPALRATRGQLSNALRAGARSSRSRGQGVVARGVVIAQVALAIVLVTAASLFAVTLDRLSGADGGFSKDQLLLISIESRGTSYEATGVGPLREAVVENVRRVPGVLNASVASVVPMFGGNTGWIDFEVAGFTARTGQRPSVRYDAVTPGYFDVMGIPLRSGRDFTKADGVHDEPVVIISATMAHRYFGSADPMGRSFRANLYGDTLSSVRVVGVAGDVKYEDLRAAPEPVLYLPFTQSRETWSNLQLALRVSGTPTSLASSVRQAVDVAAPGVRIRRMSDMREQLHVAMTVQRLATGLVTFAGVMVLVLSLIGLYSVVAYGVARRTNELGVRMALGANAKAIVWLVARETLRVVGWGVLLGLPLSYLANHAIASQLYGVGAHDPRVIGFSVIVFAGVALVACAVPARRAVRIDPCIALAAE